MVGDGSGSGLPVTPLLISMLVAVVGLLSRTERDLHSSSVFLPSLIAAVTNTELSLLAFFCLVRGTGLGGPVGLSGLTGVADLSNCSEIKE